MGRKYIQANKRGLKENILKIYQENNFLISMRNVHKILLKEGFMVSWAPVNYACQKILSERNLYLDDTFGLIYVIQMKGTSYYKIGISKFSIDYRCRQLQTGNPIKLIPIFYIEHNDIKNLEAKLHAKYSKYRCEGEWFLFNEEIDIQEVINEINNLGKESC